MSKWKIIENKIIDWNEFTETGIKFTKTKLSIGCDEKDHLALAFDKELNNWVFAGSERCDCIKIENKTPIDFFLIKGL